MVALSMLRLAGRLLLVINVATCALQHPASESMHAQIDARGHAMVMQPDIVVRPEPKLEGSAHSAVLIKKSDPVVRSQKPARHTTYHVFPMWAQLLSGFATTLIIMGFYFYVKSRLSDPVPRGVDIERLHVVLEETKQRVQSLKQELDQRYAPETETIPLEGEDPEATAARARARDLLERTEIRAREIRTAAAGFAESRDDIIASTERVQDTFKEVIDSGRERLDHFAKQETTDLYKHVEQAVSEGNIPPWEAPDWMAPSEDEDFLTLPPLMNLLQGAVAVRSIHMVQYSCKWKVTYCFVMLTLSVVIFVKDWHKHCQDKNVWVFHIGLLSLNTLDITARVVVDWWCGTALNELRESRDETDKDNSVTTGNSLFDIAGILKRGSDDYFDGFFLYQRIVDSWTYAFLQLLTLLNLLWGGYGVWISVHDVIIDSLACNATGALEYLHSYCFFYIMFFTWNLLVVLFAVVSWMSTSKWVSTPIVKMARKFDDDTMSGIPVALTLAESFVLKNSASSLLMNQREVKDDLRKLTRDMEELDRKLQNKKRVSEKISAAAASVPTQEEYMERYQDMMNDVFKKAKPLVGLVASNVRTEDSERSQHPRASTVTAGIRLNVDNRQERRHLRGSQSSIQEGNESEENPEEAAASDVEDF